MHKKLIRCIIAACSFLTINSSLALAQLNPSDEAQGITETAYTPLRCNQQLQARGKKHTAVSLLFLNKLGYSHGIFIRHKTKAYIKI